MLSLYPEAPNTGRVLLYIKPLTRKPFSFIMEIQEIQNKNEKNLTAFMVASLGGRTNALFECNVSF